MPNMAYCRFHNPLGNLRDCEQELDTPSRELSTEEARARIALVKLCRRIADNWTDEESGEPTLD